MYGNLAQYYIGLTTSSYLSQPINCLFIQPQVGPHHLTMDTQDIVSTDMSPGFCWSLSYMVLGLFEMVPSRVDLCVDTLDCSSNCSQGSYKGLLIVFDHLV